MGDRLSSGAIETCHPAVCVGAGDALGGRCPQGLIDVRDSGPASVSGARHDANPRSFRRPEGARGEKFRTE
jgi:hypothetical protein